MLVASSINPAFTGCRDVMSVSLYYRNQMSGFEGAPKTQGLSVHGPIKKKNIAIGVSLINNKIGVSNNVGVFSNYAYRIYIGKKDRVLSFGLGAGFFTVNHKWTQIVTREENDEPFNYDSPALIVPDVSLGIYYYTKKYFIGASIPFFIDYSYNELSDKYNLNKLFSDNNYFISSGYLFSVSQNITLKPSILVAYNKNIKMPIDINCNFLYKENFWVGASYRIKKAMIAMVGFKANPQLSIGYCFEYSTSELSKSDNGTHEIFIRYDICYTIDTRSPRF